MDPDLGRRDAEASTPAQAVPAVAQVGSQAMLAEYSALRAEVEPAGERAVERTCAPDHLSRRNSKPSDLACRRYCIALGHSAIDLHARVVVTYSMTIILGSSAGIFVTRCRARLQGNLAWESWKIVQMGSDVHPGRWLTATGWNPLHPTRLAFEGVAWLALVAAASAASYAWQDMTPEWGLILGFAFLWILGALATHFLHRSFNRSRAQSNF